MRSLRAGSILAIAVLLVASPALAGDLIQKTDGTWMAAKVKGDRPDISDYENSLTVVLAENYDYVIFSLKVPSGKAMRQKIETSLVKKVNYWPIPKAWSDAASAMDEGRYDEALKRFDTIAQNRGARFWMRMYALRNIAKIYKNRGRHKDVIAVNQRLLQMFPKSRYLPEAKIETGLAYMYLGDLASARAAFASLQRVSGLPAGKKMLARYWLIYLKQRQGELAGNKALVTQALGEYRDLLGTAGEDPKLKEVAVLARLGIGDCLVALGKYAEALDFFQKIADSSEDKTVLAGAFNGLGRCYFEQRKYKEALVSYLRTVILYDVKPRETARALYNAGWMFELLQGKGWKERSRQLYAECIRRFGAGTQWGKLAQEGLNRIR